MMNFPPAPQGRKISKSTPAASECRNTSAYAGTVMTAALTVSINTRGSMRPAQVMKNTFHALVDAGSRTL